MSDKFRFNGIGLEIGIPLSNADSSAISQWAENAADLARKHEQERIIKLLESQIHGCSGYDCDSCDDSSQIVDLIELIKGETQ